MKDVQLIVNKVLELISEIETYRVYKQNLIRRIDSLFADYQSGTLTYFSYEKSLKRILKGRSKEDWMEYYDSYVYSLLKKIETYNSQLFYEAYNNNDFENIVDVKVQSPLAAVKSAVKSVVKPVVKPIPEHAATPVHAKPALAKPAHVASVQTDKQFIVAPDKSVPHLVEIKSSLFERLQLFMKRLVTRRELDRVMDELKTKVKPIDRQAASKPIAKPSPVHVSRPSLFERLFSKHSSAKKAAPVSKHVAKPVAVAKPVTKPVAKPVTKPEEAIALGSGFNMGYFKNLINRKRKITFSDIPSKGPISTYHLAARRRREKPKVIAEAEKISTTSFTKEARRIRSIMDSRKSLKVYQPSFFGSFANMSIKHISLYLLDQFPEFFKDLYHAIRLANIKILSNTYVNMMVLGVIASSFLGLFVFGFFFAATSLPLLQVLFRTLMMSLLLGIAIFAGFYAYPYSMMKARRASINANLPFAINHMAAVSSSGVAPIKMFRLIADSTEYGEVSSEIEKIVNYVDVFGYDVLTSLKAVSATTPSFEFKDFFEGMISTTQTGGDLKQFFSQKADEAMLNYKLERQQYTETIATYSDIYTGILIAAPLFFVAALSLVSLLGGKVGGMDVNVIIVMGTYVVIPFMNIAFLTFLTVTQPEI
ncbi:type II secretion system F family protein [Candidatus Woesearchaeota archaeon]|nr:type II secretion system F family protein [Candidatus Woesearchaeota archaeon]